MSYWRCEVSGRRGGGDPDGDEAGRERGEHKDLPEPAPKWQDYGPEAVAGHLALNSCRRT